MHVLVADSLTKVYREPEEGEQPLADGPARISAARNERESFQIVVAAEAEPLKGVRVVVSDLAQEGGATIPSSRAPVNPVGYVETRKPVYEVERTGWWPDPLLPPGPTDVAAGQRQPFWVTIHVPESAPAGVYRGVVTISAEGLTDREAPIELRVWDFALPRVPALPSAIAIYPHALSRFYHQSPVPEETLHSYWDMLFSHRLSSDDLGDATPEGMGAIIDGAAKGPFDYSAFDRRLDYCFGRGLTAFQAARLPGFQDEGPDLNRKQQERVVAYLADLAGHLEAKGWLDRAFVMVWDEPKDRRAPEVLKELQVIHRANPKLRGRLDGPVTGPLVEACEGEVDLWGMHLLSLVRGGAQARANMERWRSEGKTIWAYVACDVHHPYPNVFIDYPLIDCRMLPWVEWKYGIEAFLYWSANWFGEDNMAGDDPSEKWPNRPWVTANFVERWAGGRNTYNGDGQLIYPGGGGTALSSIRLEALRDGMEDYDYLWLLERGKERLEESGAQPELAAEAGRWLEGQEVVRSASEWEHDPSRLAAAREELAGLLERVSRATN